MAWPRYTWLFIKTLVLSISQPIWLELKQIADLKFGFITVLRYDSPLVTSLISLRFLMFSMVFLKGELFMSLKIILCLSSKLGVEIYVRFEPCTLVKLNHVMTFLEDQSEFESLV